MYEEKKIMFYLVLVHSSPGHSFTFCRFYRGPGSIRQQYFYRMESLRWKKYYYKNGKKLTDLHKIGKYYYCFAADGTMLTGWHRIHNRFRYFGKQTGRMRINQTVNGRKINSKGVWTPVVVLDPGHSAVVAGGYEPLGPGSSQLKEKDTSGTQGVATGVEEYKLNLSIGLQLRTLLQKRGFKVVMTRTNSKVALSCIDRAKVANKAKADAYIRIHANGSDNSSISGALTICTTRNSPYISSMYRKTKLSLRLYSMHMWQLQDAEKNTSGKQTL